MNKRWICAGCKGIHDESEPSFPAEQCEDGYQVLRCEKTLDHALTAAEIYEAMRGMLYRLDYYVYPSGLSEHWLEYLKRDEYGTWDKAIEAGKSYMVGSDVPTPEFLRKSRSSLTGWMKMAYRWVLMNPDHKLNVSGKRLEYCVSKRGEYVDIALPHHDKGGEKNWITRDGRTKILVNVD